MVEGQRNHSNLMKPILLTAAGNPENQDRGLIIQDGSRAVPIELVRYPSGALPDDVTIILTKL